MAKFRKIPIVINAVQWIGTNFIEIDNFISEGGKHCVHKTYPAKGIVIIETLEGQMTASLNDWIIKGVNGEFYPCKPDIFEKTYEYI